MIVSTGSDHDPSAAFGLRDTGWCLQILLFLSASGCKVMNDLLLLSQQQCPVANLMVNLLQVVKLPCAYNLTTRWVCLTAGG